MLQRLGVVGMLEELLFRRKVRHGVALELFDNPADDIAIGPRTHSPVQVVDIAAQHAVLLVDDGHAQLEGVRPFHKDILAVCHKIKIPRGHGMHDKIQLFHAALEVQKLPRKIGHERGRALGHFVHFVQSAGGLLAAAGLILRRRANDAQMLCGFFHPGHDFHHEFPGRSRAFRSRDRKFRSFFHGIHIAAGFFLNGKDGFFHFLGGAHGLFRQLAHFVGHHGKAASGFPGTGGFDGGIKGQQIGLIRHLVDDAHHLTDIAGALAQRIHGALEMQNGFLGAVNGFHSALALLLTGHGLLARGLGIVGQIAHTLGDFPRGMRNLRHGRGDFRQTETLHFHAVIHIADQQRHIAQFGNKLHAGVVHLFEDRHGLVFLARQIAQFLPGLFQLPGQLPRGGRLFGTGVFHILFQGSAAFAQGRQTFIHGTAERRAVSGRSQRRSDALLLFPLKDSRHKTAESGEACACQQSAADSPGRARNTGGDNKTETDYRRCDTAHERLLSGTGDISVREQRQGALSGTP